MPSFFELFLITVALGILSGISIQNQLNSSHAVQLTELAQHSEKIVKNLSKTTQFKHIHDWQY